MFLEFCKQKNTDDFNKLNKKMKELDSEIDKAKNAKNSDDE
jgi:hypothetical protein